uniref:Insect replication protein a n=1 Tax=Riptortus pedestris TaxID=329032 RepID=R4WDH8_RIPPE|nr:insect replication protein a [Riptortus pedestris]
MWGNDDDGAFNNEGGFDNSTMFSSPAQETEKSSKPKCLANVTVRQIIESPEEGIKIKDTEVQTVKIVGIVKQVEVKSVKIRYVIADHTGAITGFVYLDNDTESASTVVEDTYCVVTGSVRTQGGNKHIMIFSINPIEDFNYILKHLLTVVYMPLKLDSLATATEEKPIKSEMMSSYGGTSNYQSNDFGSDIDPKHRRIFDVISRSMSENGMNISEIQGALPTKLPMDQIRNTLEYLVGEGHIFTTIDENHYKSIHSTY